MHRVLCCGGRTYGEQAKVATSMDALREALKGPYVVIQGGATGADMLCKEQAIERGWPCITVHAAWGKLGKAAGHVRNQWMIDLCKPTYALAFPGGPGTADMVRKLELAGVTVWRPYG